MEKGRLGPKEGKQKGGLGQGLATQNKEMSTHHFRPSGSKSCSHFELVSTQDLRFKIRKIGKGKKSEAILYYLIISDSLQRILNFGQFYYILKLDFAYLSPQIQTSIS